MVFNSLEQMKRTDWRMTVNDWVNGVFSLIDCEQNTPFLFAYS